MTTVVHIRLQQIASSLSGKPDGLCGEAWKTWAVYYSECCHMGPDLKVNTKTSVKGWPCFDQRKSDQQRHSQKTLNSLDSVP
jgi:hypothetical protein